MQQRFHARAAQHHGRAGLCAAPCSSGLRPAAGATASRQRRRGSTRRDHARSCGAATDPSPTRSIRNWRAPTAAFNILRDVFEGLTAVGPDGARGAGRGRRLDRVRRTASSTGSRCATGCAGRTAIALVADDYVAGMRRLVDPATASPYAQILEPVVNATAITRGERAGTELGVSAPDDRTVADPPAAPAPYLLGLLAQPGTFPVHGPSLAANSAWSTRGPASSCRTAPSC